MERSLQHDCSLRAPDASLGSSIRVLAFGRCLLTYWAHSMPLRVLILGFCVLQGECHDHQIDKALRASKHWSGVFRKQSPTVPYATTAASVSEAFAETFQECFAS
eukprot:4371452-Amphidinium_carterae.1